MDSTICYWKMFRNTTLKMVNFEPFVEIQKEMAKQVFGKVSMLKHRCCANEKRRLTNIV